MKQTRQLVRAVKQSFYLDVYGRNWRDPFFRAKIAAETSRQNGDLKFGAKF